MSIDADMMLILTADDAITVTLINYCLIFIALSLGFKHFVTR